MKKKIILISILFLISTNIFAQKTYDIDSAIELAASEISSELPKDVPTAVVKIFSDSKDLSTYISDTIVAKLSQKKKQKMIERNESKMALINAEVDYQYSGSVNDASMVEIGYQIGAKYLVYGSFDQLGDLMQLTVQSVNVETAEIVYLNSFSIKSSSKIADLLGDQKKLITASDFIETIARCDTKINAIQRDKEKEIQKKRLIAENKYNEKVAAVNSWEQDPWESDIEFIQRKAEEIEKHTQVYNTEVSTIEKSVATTFDNQIRLIEIQQKQISDDLKKTTFNIDGDSVNVSIGNFDKNASLKNWPVTVKSLDKMVNYTYKGMYVVNEVDIKKDYQEIEAIKAKNSFSGEIVYKIVPSERKNDVYEIVVIKVRVYDDESGKTLLNEDLEEKAGNANLGLQKKGTSEKKTSQKSNTSTANKTTTTKSTEDKSSDDLEKQLAKEKAENEKLKKSLDLQKKLGDKFPIYIFNDEIAKPFTFALGGWGNISNKAYKKDFYEGKSCLQISNMNKYGEVMIPISKKDLSIVREYKSNAYLTMYVKFENNRQKINVRFHDTADGNNWPWRLAYEVNAKGKKLNDWVYIRIPISDMNDTGGYKNDKWIDGQGKFDFSRIEWLSIAFDWDAKWDWDEKWEGKIYIDDIKIIVE